MRHIAGFTLIEFLLYMSLLSIFLLVLTDIFVSILDVQNESIATSNVEQDERFLLSRLSYDISRADSIISPLNLGEATDSLKLVSGGVTYTYTTSSGNLVLTDDLGSSDLNSSGVNIINPSFLKIGNPGGKETIKLQFTINSLTLRPSGSQTRTIKATIGRR